jgi:hypothetical protein
MLIILGDVIYRRSFLCPVVKKRKGRKLQIIKGKKEEDKIAIRRNDLIMSVKKRLTITVNLF